MGIAFLVAALNPLVSMLNQAQYGINTLIGNIINPIVSAFPGYVGLILIIFACGLLTNFFNNMICAMLATTALGSIVALGLNWQATCVALVMSTSLAIILPSGSPATAAMFVNSDVFDKKLWMRDMTIMCVLQAIFLGIVGYPVACLFI